MYAKSAKQVLAKIKNSKLEFARGEGYWYFIYDDVPANFYETLTIPVCYLNQYPLDRWVEDGLAFIAECEKKIAEIAEEPSVMKFKIVKE